MFFKLGRPRIGFLLPPRPLHRFGGPGTKRQKCVEKRSPDLGPVRVWTALRVASEEHLRKIEEYSAQDPPKELVEALKQATLIAQKTR